MTRIGNGARNPGVQRPLKQLSGRANKNNRKKNMREASQELQKGSRLAERHGRNRSRARQGSWEIRAGCVKAERDPRGGTDTT